LNFKIIRRVQQSSRWHSATHRHANGDSCPAYRQPVKEKGFIQASFVLTSHNISLAYCRMCEDPLANVNTFTKEPGT